MWTCGASLTSEHMLLLHGTLLSNVCLTLSAKVEGEKNERSQIQDPKYGKFPILFILWNGRHDTHTNKNTVVYNELMYHIKYNFSISFAPHLTVATPKCLTIVDGITLAL